MPAYFIVFVEEPADQAEIDAYRRIARPSLEGRNAKFHTNPNCEVTTLEGDEVDVVVMIEFPSVAEARDWYFSEAYQKGLKHRRGTANSRAVIVEKMS